MKVRAKGRRIMSAYYTTGCDMGEIGIQHQVTEDTKIYKMFTK